MLRRRGRALVEREGLVVDEVIAEVEHGAHDLLVVGASSESEPRGWGQEDTTERLLLTCPVSTLVVRRP
jgi:nucleotide-binding universal stress UspA family protein